MMDKATKEYLAKKMAELRKKAKKFNKKNNWKEFRATVNKEKDR